MMLHFYWTLSYFFHFLFEFFFLEVDLLNSKLLLCTYRYYFAEESPRRAQFVQYLFDGGILDPDQKTISTVLRHYGSAGVPYPENHHGEFAVHEYNFFHSLFKTPTMDAFASLQINNIQLYLRASSEYYHFYHASSGFDALLLKVAHNQEDVSLRREYEANELARASFPHLFLAMRYLSVPVPSKGKRSCLVMPLCAPLSRGLDLKLIKSAACFGSLSEAIRAINSLGCSYLDAKSSNFVIDSNKVVRLIDFGSVRTHGELTTAVTPHYVPRDAAEAIGQLSEEISFLPTCSEVYSVRASLHLDLWILGAALLELAEIDITPKTKQASFTRGELLDLCISVSDDELRVQIQGLLRTEPVLCHCSHCTMR